jgi:hypothetical protein
MSGESSQSRIARQRRGELSQQRLQRSEYAAFPVDQGSVAVKSQDPKVAQ